MSEVKIDAIERQFLLAEIDGMQRVAWWTNNPGGAGWATADREGCTIHPEGVVGERTLLSFHPKGEGVWVDTSARSVIDKGDLKRIHFFLAFLEDILADGDLEFSLRSELKAITKDILAQLPTGEIPFNLDDQIKGQLTKNFIANDGKPSTAKVEISDGLVIRMTTRAPFEFAIYAQDGKRLHHLVSLALDDTTFKNIVESLAETLLRNEAMLAPAPPMFEPKEFGAVVEASFRHAKREEEDESRHPWLRIYRDDLEEWLWQDAKGYSVRWSDLINPTRIGGAK